MSAELRNLFNRMKKILVIEDNQDVRENLEEILTLANYRALTAENGKVGVELAIREIPDLIISDVMMPELDGYGVLHILSRTPSTADIPFVFLTSKTEKEDFRKGMTLGADDYFPKPFDNLQLLDAIEARLKKSDRAHRNISPQANSLDTFFNEALAMKAIRSLAENREVRRYQKRDVLFAEGEHPHWLFYILKGKIKLSKTNDLGKEFILKIASEGEYIGYLSILKDSSYAKTAIALEECEVSLVPKQEFATLVFENRNITTQFVKMLASQVVDQEQRLVDATYLSVRKRVANMLLVFSKKSGDEVRLRREDMAALAGTAKETLIRTLSDFKQENLINIDDNGVHIINFSKLQNMPS
jgi:CRP-like cAMP-binding protein/FixJ family two-component response regulator